MGNIYSLKRICSLAPTDIFHSQNLGIKMKSFLRVSSSIAMACTLTLNAQNSHSAILFSDGFESGNLRATLGSAMWGAAENVSISSAVAKTGSYAAKFHFAGSSDLSADSWSELRFDLGKLTTEVWIQFDLYIPPNFKHQKPIWPC